MSMQELETRVNDGLRVRKHHFTDISSAFYWSMDARRAFADYMIEHGWVVVNCTTEADLAIAQACLPTDIVLSRDSDMLYYASIRTIWRPISKGRVLVYDIKEDMATLGLNQAQFTVLGMVSRNDYSRNIDDNISAIENYITLNSSTKSLRRTFLLTGIEHRFITFSELELILLLWQNEAVNQKYRHWHWKTLRIRRSGSPNLTYYTGFRKNRQDFSYRPCCRISGRKHHAMADGITGTRHL